MERSASIVVQQQLDLHAQCPHPLLCVLFCFLVYAPWFACSLFHTGKCAVPRPFLFLCVRFIAVNKLANENLQNENRKNCCWGCSSLWPLQLASSAKAPQDSRTLMRCSTKRGRLHWKRLPFSIPQKKSRTRKALRSGFEH